MIILEDGGLGLQNWKYFYSCFNVNTPTLLTNFADGKETCYAGADSYLYSTQQHCEPAKASIIASVWTTGLELPCLHHFRKTGLLSDLWIINMVNTL